MHRFGELIMQWPSESDARTTEPGQRVSMVSALRIEVSSCWSRGVMDWFCWRGSYLRSGVTGSYWLPSISIGVSVFPPNGPGTLHFGLIS